MKFILVVFTIVVTFSSCKFYSSDNYIQKVDSLSIKLEEASSRYYSSNKDEIKLIYDTLTSDIKVFKESLDKMPEDSTLLADFNIYSDLYRDTRNIFKLKIEKELKYSKKQLEDIKIDIESKALDSEQIEEYIYSEEQAIDILYSDINLFLGYSLKIDTLYPKLKPSINKIIEGISINNE